MTLGRLSSATKPTAFTPQLRLDWDNLMSKWSWRRVRILSQKCLGLWLILIFLLQTPPIVTSTKLRITQSWRTSGSLCTLRWGWLVLMILHWSSSWKAAGLLLTKTQVLSPVGMSSWTRMFSFLIHCAFHSFNAFFFFFTWQLWEQRGQLCYALPSRHGWCQGQHPLPLQAFLHKHVHLYQRWCDS